MSIFNFFKKSSKNEPTTAPTAQTCESSVEMQSVAVPKASSDEQPVQPKIDTTGAKRVHNLIIVDESGSMSSIYQPALTGLNETLQTIREAQKEHENQEHIVWLVTFDTSHFKQIYANTPAEKAEDITREQYRPCGGTPLYDAMGKSINQLRQMATADDVVLVTVITDGYENASREYNGKPSKPLLRK